MCRIKGELKAVLGVRRLAAAFLPATSLLRINIDNYHMVY